MDLKTWRSCAVFLIALALSFLSTSAFHLPLGISPPFHKIFSRLSAPCCTSIASIAIPSNTILFSSAASDEASLDDDAIPDSNDPEWLARLESDEVLFVKDELINRYTTLGHDEAHATREVDAFLKDR